MPNFSFKNFGFTPFMNETRAILKPELPYLYSKMLEACALFGCSHISGYIKLSLYIPRYLKIESIVSFESISELLKKYFLPTTGCFRIFVR